jgi:hypothetical protein
MAIMKSEHRAARMALAVSAVLIGAVLVPEPAANADDEKSYPGSAAVVVHDPVLNVGGGGTAAYDSVNGRVRNASQANWLSVGVPMVRDVFAVATEFDTVVVWVYDPSLDHNITCELKAVELSGEVVDSEQQASVGSTGLQSLTFSAMTSDDEVILHCDIPRATNGTVAGQSGIVSIRWIEQE